MDIRHALTVVLLIAGSGSCGLGVFQLLTGRRRPAEAVEGIVGGTGAGVCAMGLLAQGPASTPIALGGLLVSLAAAIMRVRRRDRERTIR